MFKWFPLIAKRLNWSYQYRCDHTVSVYRCMTLERQNIKPLGIEGRIGHVNNRQVPRPDAQIFDKGCVVGFSSSMAPALYPRNKQNNRGATT